MFVRRHTSLLSFHTTAVKSVSVSWVWGPWACPFYVVSQSHNKKFFLGQVIKQVRGGKEVVHIQFMAKSFYTPCQISHCSCDKEDHREGGRGSSSFSDSCVAWYLSSSLSESITISHISFRDSTRAHFAHETSPRCIVNENFSTSYPQRAKSLLNEVKILQAAW